MIRSSLSLPPRAIPPTIVAVGFIAFVATRMMHPLHGLGNADIGGILYSADTLNRGLLPYRDTVDFKSPGSFFVVAAVFRWLGRDLSILQLAYAAWLLAGAPALAVAARALYGDAREGRLAQAIAVGLYLLSMGLYDLNYASWMAPAYAWSFATMITGIRRGSRASHLLAGAFATLAYLLKTQAVVLAPLFIVIWIWGKRRGEPGAQWTTFIWWIGGATLGAAPIFAFYAAHGATADLVRGIFPIDSALRYNNRRHYALSDLRALWFIPRQQIVCFGPEITLAVATFIGGSKKKSSERAPLAPQTAFYLASLIGCALGGFRFYIHYMPQCLPAWVLLAAHPEALAWLSRRLAPWRSVVGVLARAHTVLLIGVLAYALGRIPFGKAAAIDNRGTRAVEQIGALVRENTSPDDRVLVWGWQAWGVYYFADRRSPSTMFKMLGEVTDVNDNAAVSNTTQVHFRDGPLARQLMRDVREHPPAFIVRATPFFPGLTTDPLDEFTDLKTLLDEDYVLAARIGEVDAYRRVEHPAHEGTSASP